MIFRKLQSMVFLVLVSGHLAAADVVSPEVVGVLTEKLQLAVPGMRIGQIRESGMSGVYEVRTVQGEIIYISASGEFVFAGDLLQLQGSEVHNITENSRAGDRARLLASVPATELISFVPAGEVKRTITVFTDVDCAYCRKLHHDVPALNAMGIQVSYLAFPRSEPGSPSFQKAISVWCAKDRLKAMTDAKSGAPVEEKICADNPVEAHYRLGEKLGVTGTPAIFAGDGQVIRGYLPPDKLAQALGLK